MAGRDQVNVLRNASGLDMSGQKAASRQTDVLQVFKARTKERMPDGGDESGGVQAMICTTQDVTVE